MSDSRKALSARSVLASALLGSRHGALPVARLVRVAELFGISDNAARVALSRMVANGELTTVDGRYVLAGHLQERRGRQARGRSGPPADWDGRWWLVSIQPGPRAAAQRADHRRALTAGGLAELRDGLWVRPANIDIVPFDFASRARAEWVDHPPSVAELWDLVGWAADARELLSELRATRRTLDRRDPAPLADGFVLSAAVLRHLSADPLLPASLLPRHWPGDRLRTAYDDWDGAYRRLLAHWHAHA